MLHQPPVLRAVWQLSSEINKSVRLQRFNAVSHPWDSVHTRTPWRSGCTSIGRAKGGEQTHKSVCSLVCMCGSGLSRSAVYVTWPALQHAPPSIQYTIVGMPVWKIVCSGVSQNVCQKCFHVKHVQQEDQYIKTTVEKQTARQVHITGGT